MFQRFLNFKTIIALVAILIVTGTIFYSKYISQKIEADEKLKIEQWAEAVRFNSDPTNTETRLSGKILSENSLDIPIILVTEKQEILDHRNLDSLAIVNDKNYLAKKINEFKLLHEPIIWNNPFDTTHTQTNTVYYGESKLLNEVRYYPIIQLLIVILFIAIVLMTLQSGYKSTQNQVWAGLAKETAHQLGTPVSSLEGWLEMLKDIKGNEKVVPEIEKDISRLQLITDRFGKIGSKPQVEEKNIVAQVQTMIDYIKKRAGQNVIFNLKSSHQNIVAHISPPLFDWVIENLLKNALDAMEGKGSINITINEDENKIYLEVTDTGKGISKGNIGKVFKPGFTTKKRGWGLGLTLTRRIIEQYHKGTIYVKNSELNKGTTFKIELKK